MDKNFDNTIDFVERKTFPHTNKMPVAHFHTKHELYFLEKGRTKYFIGSEIYLLTPGDFIFVPKGEFHQTDSEEVAHIERVVLMFDDEFLGEEYAEKIRTLTASKHVHIPKEHIAKLRDILQKIEHEENARTDDYREMGKLYLRQLLILICRYHQKEAPSKKLSETQQLINAAARYVSENCQENLTLEILARRYALSPYYFSKLFKEVTGIGLSHYINIARVSLAMRLLSSSNLAVDEISIRCGFNYTSYFIQTFKRLVGVTPKKYAMEFQANI